MKVQVVVVLALLFSAHVVFGAGGDNGFSRSQWVDALNGEHRSAAHAMRDRYRHPYQTLVFFGLQPEDHVVEIWPAGAGWYTEILAPLLRDKGQLTAAHFSTTSTVSYFVNAHKSFTEKLAKHPMIYNKLAMSVLQPPHDLQIAQPGSADKVLTFRNIHNWIKSGHADQVFSAIFSALKPGGVFGVVEHRAVAGTTIDQMIATGYVTEDYVKQLAERNGFLFAGSSEINANIKDSTLHPKGVWTLPPSLSLGDADRARYLAIGESDRMTLKLIKPK